jgi:hypothetical protein
MASGLYQNGKPSSHNRLGITGQRNGLYQNGKPSSHNRLGVTGPKKWPLGFTKLESPAEAIIGWVSQDQKKRSLGFTKMESPAAAIIGWVSQDKKMGSGL